MVILKNEVFMIKYRNGEKEVMSMAKEKNTQPYTSKIEPNQKSASGVSYVGTGIPLSVEEAEKIFGDQYRDFIMQMERKRKGTQLLVSGCALNLFSGAILFIGLDRFNSPQYNNNLNKSNISYPLFITFVSCGLGVSCALIPVGVVKISNGNKNIENIITSLGKENNATANKAPLELHYGGMNNGIGLALKF